MPQRPSTPLVMLLVLALTALSVAVDAAVAGLRGNTDRGPALLGGIGEPPDQVPTGSPAPGPGELAENQAVAVTLTEGWRVESRDDERLVLVGPDAVVDLSETSVSASLTVHALASEALADAQRRSPDAHLCRPAAAAALDNGPVGVAFAICYTATPLTGRAAATDQLSVQALLNRGDGARDLLSETAIFADGDAQAAVAEVDRLTATLGWKRFRRAVAVWGG